MNVLILLVATFLILVSALGIGCLIVSSPWWNDVSVDNDAVKVRIVSIGFAILLIMIPVVSNIFNITYHLIIPLG